MPRLTAIQHLLQDLRVQKTRSALTILGITWGTVAVVVLLAFGVGLQAQMSKNMHGIGEGIVLLFGGRTTKTWEGFPEGRSIRLRESDVGILATEVSTITHISPEYSERGTAVRRGRQSSTPNITGVYPVFGEMRNIIPAPGGRFLNRFDLERNRRVAVLGDALKDLLFGNEEAVGRPVFIGETPFVVVGVMVKKEQNSSYNSRDRDRIFIPASTHRTIFGDDELSNIVYRIGDPLRSDAARAQVFEVLSRKHRFDPADEDALSIWDTAEIDKFVRYFFLGFNVFMGVVGSFTLTVGGIGVANIMYVVVRERTREIGIRRSLGARRRDILLGFLLETFLIVAIGAAFGLVISVAIVQLLGLIPIQEFVGRPTISPVVLAATVLLLSAIAFLAGLFPARKAARLDPVECLRYGA